MDPIEHIIIKIKNNVMDPTENKDNVVDPTGK